ncbi:hypothetical protein Lal_00018682 [Lupinus albus]|nr:hypothetical protein Lal_00018682 [Lupinus albus]
MKQENRWYQEEDEEGISTHLEIPLTEEEFEVWCKPWRQALVVKFLGFTLRRRSLSRTRWRPFFLSSEKDVQKIEAWIRIPNLSED